MCSGFRIILLISRAPRCEHFRKMSEEGTLCRNVHMGVGTPHTASIHSVIVLGKFKWTKSANKGKLVPENTRVTQREVKLARTVGCCGVSLLVSWVRCTLRESNQCISIGARSRCVCSIYLLISQTPREGGAHYGSQGKSGWLVVVGGKALKPSRSIIGSPGVSQFAFC